jgi:hypothetical protein
MGFKDLLAAIKSSGFDASTAATQAQAAAVQAAADSAQAAAAAALASQEILLLQKGVSWPGGGIPIPLSRWHKVHVPVTANTLATVTMPAPGAGKALVVTQVVFTMVNQGVVAATKAGQVTSDVETLFGTIIAVPGVIGGMNWVSSRVPLQAPENKPVVAAFGSAGGANIFESVSLAGYVVLT